MPVAVSASWIIDITNTNTTTRGTTTENDDDDDDHVLLYVDGDGSGTAPAEDRWPSGRGPLVDGEKLGVLIVAARAAAAVAAGCGARQIQQQPRQRWWAHDVTRLQPIRTASTLRLLMKKK